MQMLGTWLVAFQDIRPGGGRKPMESVIPSRSCFQGGHPLKKALKNRNKKPPDMW